MYTLENYYWGYLAYCLGVLLVLPVIVKVSGLIMPWKPLKVFIILFFVALLVTPAHPYQGVDYLAPAWVVAVFELIRSASDEILASAITNMVMVFILLLLGSLGAFFLKRYILRKREKQPDETLESSHENDYSEEYESTS